MLVWYQYFNALLYLSQMSDIYSNCCGVNTHACACWHLLVCFLITLLEIFITTKAEKYAIWWARTKSNWWSISFTCRCLCCIRVKAESSYLRHKKCYSRKCKVHYPYSMSARHQRLQSQRMKNIEVCLILCYSGERVKPCLMLMQAKFVLMLWQKINNVAWN